jgi:signal transduction histidine kinase
MTKLSWKSLKPGTAGTLEAVNVAELIEDIVAPLRSDSAVQIHVATDAEATVLGVREQIHQVLLNVILNARQAIAGQGELSILSAQESGTVVIAVEDTGRGIPPAMLDTLFRPAQSSRPGGLGVGLYQCKQIVEAYRGVIQVQSTVGKGTQVRIELPIGTSSPARDSAVAAACSVAPS